MSALDKRGEFVRDRNTPFESPHAASLRDALRAKENSKLLIVVADDGQAIAQIRALASACVEIDDHADADAYSANWSGEPDMKGLRDGLRKGNSKLPWASCAACRTKASAANSAFRILPSATICRGCCCSSAFRPVRSLATICARDYFGRRSGSMGWIT